MGWRTRALDAITEAEDSLAKAKQALSERDSAMYESLVHLSSVTIRVGEAIGEIGEQVTG